MSKPTVNVPTRVDAGLIHPTDMQLSAADFIARHLEPMAKQLLDHAKADGTGEKWILTLSARPLNCFDLDTMAERAQERAGG